MDSTIVKVFASLGIDPAKPRHLSEFGEIEDGLRLYIGNYYIAGKLKKESIVQIPNGMTAIQRELETSHLGSGRMRRRLIPVYI